MSDHKGDSSLVFSNLVGTPLNRTHDTYFTLIIYRSLLSYWEPFLRPSLCIWSCPSCFGDCLFLPSSFNMKHYHFWSMKKKKPFFSLNKYIHGLFAPQFVLYKMRILIYQWYPCLDTLTSVLWSRISWYTQILPTFTRTEEKCYVDL